MKRTYSISLEYIVTTEVKDLTNPDKEDMSEFLFDVQKMFTANRLDIEQMTSEVYEGVAYTEGHGSKNDEGHNDRLTIRVGDPEESVADYS